jgi:hypothetical protein
MNAGQDGEREEKEADESVKQRQSFRECFQASNGRSDDRERLCQADVSS